MRDKKSTGGDLADFREMDQEIGMHDDFLSRLVNRITDWLLIVVGAYHDERESRYRKHANKMYQEFMDQDARVRAKNPELYDRVNAQYATIKPEDVGNPKYYL